MIPDSIRSFAAIVNDDIAVPPESSFLCFLCASVFQNQRIEKLTTFRVERAERYSIRFTISLDMEREGTICE